MKKAIKAALLSALVFPGAGHLLLKSYISASLFAATTLTAAYLLIAKTIENALQIVNKIQSGEVAPDITAITQSLTQQTTQDDLLLTNITTSILVVTWVIAIVDAYRIGRRQG